MLDCRRRLVPTLALVGFAAACSAGQLLPDDGGAAAATADANGASDDASPGTDARPATEGSTGNDASVGAADAAADVQSSDGAPGDAAPADSAAQDSGPGEAGATDASSADASTSADAPAADAGSNDAGSSDAGTPPGDASAGADGGAVESGSPNPSCAGLAANCGPGHDEDCCASGVVTGGPFQRDNGVNGSYPATVSAFRLDRFEITVGRFRKFYAQFPADDPAGSSGINANVAADQGWNATWDGSGYLETSQSALDAAAECTSPSWQNWTLGSDTLPMNCISWYDAYAFCIWDGGRLPTELEWNYAAAGGSDQRPYPWSTSPTDQTIDSSYAVYAPAAAVYAPVGSTSPKGDGRWGQADLAGNVMEWVEDWYNPYPATCADCAYVPWNRVNTLPAPYRQVRGGSAGDSAYYQLTSSRWYWNVPTFRVDVIGARCARNP